MLKAEQTMERIYVDNVKFYGRDLIERHIERYKWALDYLNKNDSVLDLCCGSGYGTQMISNKCENETFGIDKNRRAIEYARQRYKNKYTKYFVEDVAKKMSILCLCFKESKFDSIVFIEAIEHFTFNQASLVLFKLSKILKMGGKLLITTPDYNKSDKINKFHTHEYTLSELSNLVLRYFNIIDVKVKKKFIYMVAEQNGKWQFGN